ncbi:hypothetical protein H0H93_013911, partial [Arthromyces matolae]
RRDVARQEVRDARERVLDELKPELDVDCLTEGISSEGKKLTRTELIQQINWHRRYDEKIPRKGLIDAMKKEDMLTQLIVTVTRYNKSKLANTSSAASKTGDHN